MGRPLPGSCVQEDFSARLNAAFVCLSLAPYLPCIKARFRRPSVGSRLFERSLFAKTGSAVSGVLTSRVSSRAPSTCTEYRVLQNLPMYFVVLIHYRWRAERHPLNLKSGQMCHLHRSPRIPGRISTEIIVEPYPAFGRTTCSYAYGLSECIGYLRCGSILL